MNNVQTNYKPFTSNKVLSITIIALNSLLAMLGIFSTLADRISSGDENPIQALLGIFIFMLIIVEFILFLVWVNHSNKNLSALGEVKEYSSGWAVGWFFIPVMSLFKPCSIVREIWDGSSKMIVQVDGVKYKKNEPSGLVIIWWIVWLVSNFLDRIILRMNLRRSLYSQPSPTLELVSDLLDIVSYILTAVIVYKITHFQNEKYKNIQIQQQQNLEFERMSQY